MWYKYHCCCCANSTILRFDKLLKQSKHKRIHCGFCRFFPWNQRTVVVLSHFGVVTEKNQNSFLFRINRLRAQNVKIATGLIRFHCCVSILSIKHAKLISFTNRSSVCFIAAHLNHVLSSFLFKDCSILHWDVSVQQHQAQINREICPILGLNLVWITFHSLANFYFNSRMTHRTKFRKWNIWTFIRSLFIASRADESISI